MLEPSSAGPKLMHEFDPRCFIFNSFAQQFFYDTGPSPKPIQWADVTVNAVEWRELFDSKTV